MVRRTQDADQNEQWYEFENCKDNNVCVYAVCKSENCKDNDVFVYAVCKSENCKDDKKCFRLCCVRV